MSWPFTRRTEPNPIDAVAAVASTVAATPVDDRPKCTSCLTGGHDMHLLDLDDFGPQWVCKKPGPCNDRAAAGGVWEGRPR